MQLVPGKEGWPGHEAANLAVAVEADLAGLHQAGS